MEALEIVHGRFTKTSQRNSIAGKVKHKDPHLLCSHKAPQLKTIKWIIYLPLGIVANVRWKQIYLNSRELVLTSHLWDQSWLRVPQPCQYENSQGVEFCQICDLVTNTQRLMPFFGEMWATGSHNSKHRKDRQDPFFPFFNHMDLEVNCHFPGQLQISFSQTISGTWRFPPPSPPSEKKLFGKQGPPWMQQISPSVPSSVGSDSAACSRTLTANPLVILRLFTTRPAPHHPVPPQSSAISQSRDHSR